MQSNADESVVTGIECVTAAGRAVIASSDVDQVVEYAVASVPLAREWVAGLAVQGDELVVSIRLDGGTQRDAHRATKAVLLAARSRGALRWAIEIDEVRSFVQVRPTLARDGSPSAAGRAGSPASAGSARAPWLVAATGADGADVALLDVARMLADLGAGEPRT
jgi:hypothetical protein